MNSNPIGSIVSVLLFCGLLNPALIAAPQAPPPAQATATPKYKLTVLEDASSSKRVKKGRVSSQAVVKITDENDVPVAGIAVAFTLPQLSGGAAFAGGGLTSVATTSATGIASSGAFSAAAGSSFGVSVSASVPGGVLTGTVSVSTTAAAAAGSAGTTGAGAGGAGAGVSTGLIVGIVAGVGAAAAVAAKVLSKSAPPTTPPAQVPATPGVGSASSITFGPPK
jgi:hypothetical protein